MRIIKDSEVGFKKVTFKLFGFTRISTGRISWNSKHAPQGIRNLKMYEVYVRRNSDAFIHFFLITSEN